MPEKPHLVYDLDARDMPRDIEASLSGYRLVSEPLKTCYTRLTHKALHSLQ
jgi:hypothetical protein